MRPKAEDYDGTAKSYVASFPVGKRITAYYDPDDPSEAVLTTASAKPRAMNSFIVVLTGVFFVIIVGPGLWSYLKK